MLNTAICNDLKVDRSLTTHLYLQLSANMRWCISTGKIAAGDLLPPVRDLAQCLGLSVNTVLGAYHELKKQHLIVSRPKRGTEVIGPTPVESETDPKDGITAAMLQAVSTSLALGYTIQDVRQLFEASLDQAVQARQGKPIVFVECTQFDAELLARQLEGELKVPVIPVVLDQLVSWLAEHGDKAVAGAYRPVVTTFFHYTAVMQTVSPVGLPVFGVVVEIGPETIDAVARLGVQGKIGVICRRREDSAQYYLNAIQNITRGKTEYRLAYIEQPRELEAVLDWGDLFFVTQPCKAKVETLRPKAKLCFFYDQINTQSIAMLKQDLDRA
jgi:DNA-binding transcriptional regulator YhcF (GntR family)